MSAGYALAYRVGVTPWERAGEAAADRLARLLHREELDRPRPLGRALDVGCGTGKHTIELAERGWEAVGVDNIDRAIEKARTRPVSGSVRFVVGDVTDLSKGSVEPGFDFLLDVGCFHGLDNEERRQYGHEVTALSAPDATFLMLCFRPGRRIGLPRGASLGDVEQALPEWTVISQDVADTSGMPGPLKKTAPLWYRLRLR